MRNKVNKKSSTEGKRCISRVRLIAPLLPNGEISDKAKTHNKLYIISAFLLLICSLLGGLSVYSDTPEPTLTQTPANDPLSNLNVASSALLYNIESDTLMYTKEQDKKVAPATTAKMMTALVALNILNNRMEEEVTIPSVVMQNAVGTHMELQTGEVIKIKELFHGLIMANANDAAYMLALVCCESIENFVVLMNQAAKEYGMENTNYVNVTGIDDDGAYTTAYDVMLMSKIAFNNEVYKEIAAKPTYTIPATNKKRARELHARNYMLSKLIYPNYYYKNANGLCAGSTEKGGYCISATAEIDNMNFIAVVMGAPGSYQEGFYNFICARTLFDWGPSSFSYRTVITSDKIVGELKVDLAEEYDYVAVVTEGTLSKYLPNNMNLDEAVRYDIEIFQETLTAPVEDKQVVGSVTVYVEDEEVGTIALVTLRGLSLSRKDSTIRTVQLFFTNKTVLTVFGVIAISFVLGVLIYARYLYVKKRKIRVKAHTEDD